MKVFGNPSSLFRLHTPPSNPPLSHTSSHPLRLSCSFKPTKPPKPPSLFASTPPPAKDRVIDFGKYKGKMVGTLISAYLKWVSKNLRSRDFEEWVKLTDQVLDDVVYRDRIKWELAKNILNGNRRKTDPASDVVSSTNYGGAKPFKNPNFPKPISPFHRYIHSAQAQAVDSKDSEQEEERMQRERAEVRWFEIEGFSVGLSRWRKES
ncbi:hypothetical protein ACFX2G_022137 [Malus domestica]